MADVKWYVLRAVSGQEKKVKAYLETEIARQGIEEYIPEILIPAEKIVEIRNGKKRIREKSFFPGYVMLSADLSNPEIVHTITSIPGVIGFLTMSGHTKASKDPIPLRQSEINRILGKAEEAAQEATTPTVSFMKGEEIRVIDGPFSGFSGNVEEVFDERKKLNVMVKIFGRNTPVELNYTQVEKLV
jgi:transcription termination/antitermination protein NusG